MLQNDLNLFLQFKFPGIPCRGYANFWQTTTANTQISRVEMIDQLPEVGDLWEML